MAEMRKRTSMSVLEMGRMLGLAQAKTHFKRAFKIYEKIWADEPEMIEAKYQEIQELYPQVSFFLGQQIS